MRFCLTTIFFIFTISATVGCSTKKLDSKVVVVQSSVEPTSDGILITRIEVDSLGEELRDKIVKFGLPLESKVSTSNLENEGLYVRHVDVIDLPEIIASVGTVENQSFVWHGQIINWRDLEQRKIPEEGILISENGFANFINRGYLSLLARSWPIQREDGLFVYLQLLPSWHIPRGSGIIVGGGSLPEQSKLFSNLGFEVLLQEGEAIIIAASLNPSVEIDGPQVGGLPPVRLGEALLGGPVDSNMVVLLVIEANILPRE